MDVYNRQSAYRLRYQQELDDTLCMRYDEVVSAGFMSEEPGQAPFGLCRGLRISIYRSCCHCCRRRGGSARLIVMGVALMLYLAG